VNLLLLTDDQVEIAMAAIAKSVQIERLWHERKQELRREREQALKQDAAMEQWMEEVAHLDDPDKEAEKR